MIDLQRLHEESYRWEVVVALMEDHGTALTQYCRTWLGEAIAEEITLEVFLAAWRMLPQYRPEATLRTWLFGIARHQCQQAYRNRARRQAIVVTFADEIRARVQAEAPPAPDAALGHEQQLRQLEASLAQLPREERLLVILRYWKALPLAEIAEITGLSRKTIGRRLQRAEQHLKDLMDASAATSPYP